MKKIKKLWNENRVMFVLGITVIVCFLIILGVMMKYFFGTSSSNYGDRLDDIQNVSFSSEQQDSFKNSVMDEKLLEVSVDVRGKVIYAILKYDSSVGIVEAQNKAIEAYRTIEEKYRNLYDFNVTVLQDKTEEVSGYRLMGAKNVSSTSFVWSNNTPIENEGE